jgi:excisionase family DNA binding protein
VHRVRDCPEVKPAKLHTSHDDTIPKFRNNSPGPRQDTRRDHRMPPVLLTARELAERLSVSYESVLQWARRDEIPCIRDGRKRVLFNLDRVLTAMRDRQQAVPS